MAANPTADSPFETWAILELMGHVRMGGLVTEEERFGAKMGRIDVPRVDGTFTTVFFGGASVYRLTPTTEAIARAVAVGNQPRPVSPYELPAPERARAGVATSHDDMRLDLPDDDDIREDDEEF